MILAFEALNVSVPIQFGGSGLVDQDTVRLALGAEDVGYEFRIPQARVFEDSCDDISIDDERDDAHGGAAAGALERVTSNTF